MQRSMQRNNGRGVTGSDIAAGALVGCIGSMIMTTLQEPGLPRLLSPAWRPHDFVPRQVVRWLEHRTKRVSLRTRQQETAAAVVAHLGYGAAMGALYGAVYGALRSGVPGRGAGPSTAGAVWGLVVWAAGYEGWLPATGVRPATTEHPPREWPVPVANHVLYGMVVAHAFERVRERRPEEGG